jgi:hypothetical protein
VANGQHQDMSLQGISKCALALHSIMQKGRIALDNRFLILNEYQNKTQPRQGKGPGDLFVKWALQNNANTAKCDRVTLVDHLERGFESFPADSDLMDFDPPDRKFVAVSVAHPHHPPILNGLRGRRR